MKLKNTLIAGLLLATASVVAPSGAEAQTVRAQVCTATAEFLVDRRQFITQDIRAIRSLLRQGGGELEPGERQSLLREIVQLRARRQMLRIAERNLGRFAITQTRRTANGAPSAVQCRSLNRYITRVASYT